ncbi:nicotinate-nicotinamide nucleotide adenylyltransferase [Roseateles sp. GG27B]
MAVGQGARTGLFGGSFDPPHLAHLSLAHCALTQLKLDRLLWLPAGRPWQKPAVVWANRCTGGRWFRCYCR